MIALSVLVLLVVAQHALSAPVSIDDDPTAVIRFRRFALFLSMLHIWLKWMHEIDNF